MLKSIHIRNYALLEKLDMDFGKGFSVITGETGAGKSIILGAINMLLGQRADNKILNDRKCVIEATFDVAGYDIRHFFEINDLEYDDECIVRREISPSGKSRSFINDTPVSQALTKELGSRLIDIHSQHKNLLIDNENFQTGVLDILAGNRGLLEKYRTAYSRYTTLNRKLAQLTEAHNRNKEDEDYISFRLEELKAAALKEGEQEALEEEENLLNHAEEIKETLYRTNTMFYSDDNGIIDMIKMQLNALSGIKDKLPQIEDISSRLESAYIELKDIYRETSCMEEDITFDQGRLDEITARLDTIYSLEQKHRKDSVEELLEIQDSLQEQLDRITSFDDDINALKEEIDKEYSVLTKTGKELRESRLAAARDLEQKMTATLVTLGMPNVKFKVELTEREKPSENGLDSTTYLFSANKNQAMQELSSVASGGEIARVMLSLKAIISQKEQLPTIIFDEIDTGVSGEIASKMADIMAAMGENMQVISITHLPQIASKGRYHYKVYKQDDSERTKSNIIQLSKEERIEEIAHMLSGETLTQAAIDNAKDLLKI